MDININNPIVFCFDVEKNRILGVDVCSEEMVEIVDIKKLGGSLGKCFLKYGTFVSEEEILFSTDAVEDGSRVFIFNIDEKAIKQEIKFPNADSIWHVCVPKEIKRNLIYLSFWDEYCKVFSLDEMKEILSIRHDSLVNCSCYYPRYNFLVSGSYDTTYKIMDMETLKQIVHNDSKNGSVNYIDYDNFDNLIYFANAMSISFYDSRTISSNSKPTVELERGKIKSDLYCVRKQTGNGSRKYAVVGNKAISVFDLRKPPLSLDYVEYVKNRYTTLGEIWRIQCLTERSSNQYWSCVSDRGIEIFDFDGKYCKTVTDKQSGTGIFSTGVLAHLHDQCHYLFDSREEDIDEEERRIFVTQETVNISKIRLLNIVLNFPRIILLL